MRRFNGYSFNKCDNLVHVEMPPKLRRMNNFAFGLCPKLLTHDWSQTKLVYIGTDAFNQSFALDSTGVANIILGGDLQTISDRAFTYAPLGITNMTIGSPENPSQLVTIGPEAVRQNDNEKLQNLTIYCTADREIAIDALVASGNIEYVGTYESITV